MQKRETSWPAYLGRSTYQHIRAASFVLFWFWRADPRGAVCGGHSRCRAGHASRAGVRGGHAPQPAQPAGQLMADDMAAWGREPPSCPASARHHPDHHVLKSETKMCLSFHRSGPSCTRASRWRGRTWRPRSAASMPRGSQSARDGSGWMKREGGEVRCFAGRVDRSLGSLNGAHCPAPQLRLRAAGLGPVSGGYMFSCSAGLCRRLLQQQPPCAVLATLGRSHAFDLAVSTREPPTPQPQRSG